jgi:hypothetical protein
MGRLTSLDRIALLRSGLGDPSTDDVPDAELGQYLWLAEMQLAIMHEPVELITYEDVSTVADQSDVEMTAAKATVLKFIEPANNTSENNFPMDMMDADWDRQQGIYLSGGQPWFWFPHGVGSNGRYNIRFRPIPDDVYVIRIPYIKTPTEPDISDGNISDLPVGFDQDGIGKAIAIGLEMTNMRTEAERQNKLAAVADFVAQNSLPITTTHTHSFMRFSDLIRRR